jgi:hypothetical protein
MQLATDMVGNMLMEYIDANEAVKKEQTSLNSYLLGIS